MITITLLGRFDVAVDANRIPESHWARRRAAALIKVLALAPGRRLHREEVIDLLWPDDDLGWATPKLHKADHFARRAIDVPDSVVLHGESVALCPETEATVDVVEFEALARRALAGEDRALGLRHLDLLRLDGRWETSSSSTRATSEPIWR